MFSFGIALILASKNEKSEDKEKKVGGDSFPTFVSFMLFFGIALILASKNEDSSMHTEDFRETDQASAGVSQRCEFFELSPR